MHKRTAGDILTKADVRHLVCVWCAAVEVGVGVGLGGGCVFASGDIFACSLSRG